MVPKCWLSAQEFLRNQNNTGVWQHGFLSLPGGKQNTLFFFFLVSLNISGEDEVAIFPFCGHRECWMKWTVIEVKAVKNEQDFL